MNNLTSDNKEGYQQAEEFLKDNPDIEIIEVLLTDLNGIARGKWLPRSSLKKVFSGGDFKMSLSAVTPDIWGRDVDELCAATGDADGLCSPIASSLKRMPWLQRPTAQMFLQLHDEDGEPCSYDPRVVLKRVYKRYQKLGLRPVSAPELEFHLFSGKRDAIGAPQLPYTRSNGHTNIGGQLYSLDVMQEQSDVLHEIREAADAMGLPLDGLLKELGPAQYELNMYHLDNPLQVADNAVMLKRVVKGVAQKHGYIASFMAKPFAAMDGNGMHVHTSILDDEGDNIFDDGSDQGNDKLGHAIAGLANSMPEVMLLFAPHMNSFRRLKAGNNAPIAPTWGYENRDVALRIPSGNPKARRIEHRVGGADANAYLVQAAILSGILNGISHKMQPDQPINNSLEQQQASLPQNWSQAIDAFAQSEFVATELGDKFRHVYSTIKRAEMAEFDRMVSPLEYDTYLTMS